MGDEPETKQHRGVHVMLFPDGTAHCEKCETDYPTAREAYECAARHLDAEKQP